MNKDVKKPYSLPCLCLPVSKKLSPEREKAKADKTKKNREGKKENKNEINTVVKRLMRTTALLPKALQSPYAYEKGKNNCETCNMDKETYKLVMKSVKVVELIADEVIGKVQNEMLDKDERESNKPNGTVSTKEGKTFSMSFNAFCPTSDDHNFKCVLLKLQKSMGDLLLQLCYCKVKEIPDDEKCKNYNASLNTLEHLKFEYTNLTNNMIRLFKTPPNQKTSPEVCVACMKEEIDDCREILEDLLKYGRNLKVTMRNEEVGDKCCSRKYPHVHALVQNRHVVLKFDLPFEVTQYQGDDISREGKGDSEVLSYDQWLNKGDTETESKEGFVREPPKTKPKEETLREPTQRKLSEESSKMQPSVKSETLREPTQRKPSEESSKMQPSVKSETLKEPTQRKPSEESSKMQPSVKSETLREPTQRKPSEESSKEQLSVKSVKMQPSVESTKREPTVEPQKVEPKEKTSMESTQRKPSVESSKTQPSVKSLKIQPSVESTKRGSSVEPQNAKPKEESELKPTKQEPKETAPAVIQPPAVPPGFVMAPPVDQKKGDLGYEDSPPKTASKEKADNEIQKTASKETAKTASKETAKTASKDTANEEKETPPNSSSPTEDKLGMVPSKAAGSKETPMTSDDDYDDDDDSVSLSSIKKEPEKDKHDCPMHNTDEQAPLEEAQKVKAGGSATDTSLIDDDYYSDDDSIDSSNLKEGEKKRDKLPLSFIAAEDEKNIYNTGTKNQQVFQMGKIQPKSVFQQRNKDQSSHLSVSRQPNDSHTGVKKADSRSLNKEQISKLLKDMGAVNLLSASAKCCKENPNVKDFKCITDLPFSPSLQSLPLDQDDLNHITKAVEKMSDEEVVLISGYEEWEIEYTGVPEEDKSSNPKWHKAFTARDATSNLCIEIQTSKPVTKKRISKSPSQGECSNLPTINEEDEGRSRIISQYEYGQIENKSQGNKKISKGSFKTPEIRYFTLEYPKVMNKIDNYKHEYKSKKNYSKPDLDKYDRYLDKYYIINLQSWITNEEEVDSGYLSDDLFSFCGFGMERQSENKIKHNDELVKNNHRKVEKRCSKKCNTDKMIMMEVIHLDSGTESEMCRSINSSNIPKPRTNYKQVLKPIPSCSVYQERLNKGTLNGFLYAQGNKEIPSELSLTKVSKKVLKAFLDCKISKRNNCFVFKSSKSKFKCDMKENSSPRDEQFVSKSKTKNYRRKKMLLEFDTSKEIIQQYSFVKSKTSVKNKMDLKNCNLKIKFVESLKHYKDKNQQQEESTLKSSCNSLKKVQLTISKPVVKTPRINKLVANHDSPFLRKRKKDNDIKSELNIKEEEAEAGRNINNKLLLKSVKKTKKRKIKKNFPFFETQPEAKFQKSTSASGVVLSTNKMKSCIYKQGDNCYLLVTKSQRSSNRAGQQLQRKNNKSLKFNEYPCCDLYNDPIIDLPGKSVKIKTYQNNVGYNSLKILPPSGNMVALYDSDGRPLTSHYLMKVSTTDERQL